jgi:hypothetical protein
MRIVPNLNFARAMQVEPAKAEGPKAQPARKKRHLVKTKELTGQVRSEQVCKMTVLFPCHKDNVTWIFWKPRLGNSMPCR